MSGRKFRKVRVGFMNTDDPSFDAYIQVGVYWNGFLNPYLELSEVEKLVKYSKRKDVESIKFLLRGSDDTLIDISDGEVIHIKPETIKVDGENIKVWYVGSGLTWTEIFTEEEL